MATNFDSGDNKGDKKFYVSGNLTQHWHALFGFLGYPTPNGSLPELTDLSDYPHLSGSHRIRMLGTPQGGQAEFYTTPPHDTVYR